VCAGSDIFGLFVVLEEPIVKLTITLICIGLAAGLFTWWILAQDKKKPK